MEFGSRSPQPNASQPVLQGNAVYRHSASHPDGPSQTTLSERSADRPQWKGSTGTERPGFAWWRPAKFTLFALLFISGVVILYQQIVVRASRDAVINARVAVVRAPLDGIVTAFVIKPGSRLKAGMPIGNVENPLADSEHLAQLKREASDIEIERASLERNLIDLDQARSTAEGQAEAYRRGREQLLELQIEAARADLAAATERQNNALIAQARGAALHTLGFQSDEAQDRLRQTEEIERQGVVAAHARLDALTVEREAARNNTFLGDSYNDAPFSLQQAREFALRIAETRTALDNQVRKAAVLGAQIAEERKRLATQIEATLTAPVEGQLWTVEAASGEYARKGDDILTVLDCSTVVVTASASERDYNELQLGDRVWFRVSGSDRDYPGQIVKFGSSPAYAVPAPQGRQQVVVALSHLPAGSEDSCAVGRTGEVTFENVGRSLPERLTAWLPGLLRLF